VSENKWKIGPVKLVNGDNAFIDAINERQEAYRYTGRIADGNRFIPVGWYSNGRIVCSTENNSHNLAPPPKKKVRVTRYLVVYDNGDTCICHYQIDALAEAKAHGFALIEIDREVEEGEGL
jgi:hypothetical protein